MNLLSAIQARELDRAAMAAGVSAAALMDHAAAALEAAIERVFPGAMSGRIAILCGPGNNGGDGKVLAGKLIARRINVLAIVAADLDAAGWRQIRSQVLAADLVVDALFGTGLIRPLHGLLRDIVLDLNQHYAGPVLAADLPSGLCADAEGLADRPDAAVLRATATVTFAAPKRCLYLGRHAAAAGRISLAPIGIPEAILSAAPAQLRVTQASHARPFLAPRPADSHKGRYGHVFVLAGSLGKSGAAVLASTAALRMGAGLVTAAVPASVQPIVAAALPELMTEVLAFEPAALAVMLQPATVLAIGPGLGRAP
ncbi:MAG: NAD(P)H-hydrate epimerase [Terriglobales bacterium]